MTDNLRKVFYRLVLSGYIPDATQKEMEDSKEREGYFHRWVEEVDTSKDIPFIKPMALVEEAATGEMHLVDYYNITFVIDK